MTRWLIVGSGDIVRKRVGPALLGDPRSVVQGIYSRNSEQARQVASVLGALHTYESLDDALADPEIDAVYLATPVAVHCQMAVRALDAGKHVLVEKPMATIAGEAQTMVARARAVDRRLGVAYFRRYSEKYRLLRTMIEQGELGKVVFVRMCYYSWYDPPPDDPKRWRTVRDLSGGGPVSDVAVHMFDLLIGLFGLPRSVFAKASTIVHHYDVEDSAVAVMTLQNSAYATASFHWCSKTWAHELEIVGTEATVRWNPFDSFRFSITSGRTTKEIKVPEVSNVHAPLIEDFTRCLESGAELVTEGTEGALTNYLVDAFYESAATAREVQLPDPRNGVMPDNRKGDA